MEVRPGVANIRELRGAVRAAAQTARRRHRGAGKLDTDRALAGGPVVATERLARQVVGPRAVNVAGCNPMASTLTVKSRASPVSSSPRDTTCASFGSRARTHDTRCVPVGDFGVTRLHRMTRSLSGSPLATPCRNTGLVTWASASMERISGSAPSAAPDEAMKPRRERVRIRAV